MAIPYEITFRDDLEKTPALEQRIEKKIEKMSQYYDKIESCKVVIDIPQKQKHQGKQFHATIEVLVPGKKLIANKHMHEDLYVSIRDAFSAMYKQLQDYSAHQRGAVKSHPEPLTGVVARIFDNYGFIQCIDGREFYFHAPNVASPGFDSLDVGHRVKFIQGELEGETLQANHVIAISETESF